MPHRIARLLLLISQTFFRALVRWRMVWIMLLATLTLSGCVRYEVGVNFDSPNHGAIVQHIRLDGRLTSFSSGTAQAWLNSIEQRVRRLQGKTRRLSNKEVVVTIPFSYARDLERKFNQFFTPEPGSKLRAKPELDLPQIESHFKVQDGNFLLLEHNRLIYDVDLRSLGVTATDGSVLVSPESLIDLQFGLSAPWGARSITRKPDGIPARREGNQLVWDLKPGQKNHLEAAFWMPNWLGIGTVVVVAIVAAGIYFKDQQTPPVVADSPAANTSTVSS